MINVRAQAREQRGTKRACRQLSRAITRSQTSVGDLPSEVEAIDFDNDGVNARVLLRSMRVREPASLLEVKAIVRENDIGTAMMSNTE